MAPFPPKDRLEAFERHIRVELGKLRDLLHLLKYDRVYPLANLLGRHLAEAILRFEQQEWSAQALRCHAENFGVDVFQARFRKFLAKVGAPIPEYISVPFASPASAHAFEPRLGRVSNGVPA